MSILRDHIKRWEGLRLTAYQDQAGVWTIGYGHTRTAKPGMEITEAEAQRLLDMDRAEAQGAINRLVKVPLDKYQMAALVSFVFNVGTGAFQKSTLLRKLNAGDYLGAANEFSRWNKITVNGQKGG